MADNERFVIIRENELIITSSDIYQIKQLDKFIKTRAEYEDMIAETLWNKHYKVYLKTYKEALGVHDSLIECTMDTVHGLAKAVVDRLFGEGL